MKIFKIKPSKTDYLDSMLPTNRKEVFFDVFKLHWKTLLLLGIIVLILLSNPCVIRGCPVPT